jgi:hypothetical protein
VKNIGGWAFANCCNLTSVNIPEGVTSIDDYTFSYCERITTIVIPKNVTSIGESAFGNCKRLASIITPKNVTSIEVEAFNNSGITYLTILGKPTISGTAFAECKNLTDVYCYSDEAPTAYDGAFDFFAISHLTLHVPESAMEQFKNTEPWCRFGTIVAIK